MNSFDWSVKIVFKHEGGEVEHINDLGGATNLGITQALLDGHAHRNRQTVGTKYGAETVDKLTTSIARRIYFEEFWQAANIGRIDEVCGGPLIPGFIFDVAVNHGTGDAIKFLQEAVNLLNDNEEHWVNILEDGGWGPKTSAAFSSAYKYSPTRLYGLLLAVRATDYIKITQKRERNESFIIGWLNRIDEWYKIDRKYL